MSKKVRRVRRSTVPEAVDSVPEEKVKVTPPRPTPRPASSSAAAAASPGSRRASPRRDTAVRQTVTVEELKEEYAYVARDLRWVFVLAVAMFTLLIVLNLVLG